MSNDNPLRKMKYEIHLNGEAITNIDGEFVETTAEDADFLKWMQKVHDDIHANTERTPTWMVVGDPKLVKAVLVGIDGLVEDDEITEAGIDFLYHHSDLDTYEQVRAWVDGELVGPIHLAGRMEVKSCKSS